jgi:hypothetical protein
MKKSVVENIVITTLKRMLSEQAETGAAPQDQQTTDNAESDSVGLFTPAEERFLGKFDAYGSRHLGIIYSLSDIGVREFITRSGKDLNITPEILVKLYRDGIIKFVPYAGYGRDDQYTIELQLSLNDVKGLGDQDVKKAENDGASGAAGAAPDATAAAMGPGAELAWVVKYGDVLKEAAEIAKFLPKKAIFEAKGKDVEVPLNKTRILRNFPVGMIRDLKQVVERIEKRSLTEHQTVRLIADILDVLQLNLKMDAKAMRQSYQFHRDQKKLQKYMDDIK